MEISDIDIKNRFTWGNNRENLVVGRRRKLASNGSINLSPYGAANIESLVFGHVPHFSLLYVGYTRHIADSVMHAFLSKQNIYVYVPMHDFPTSKIYHSSIV